MIFSKHCHYAECYVIFIVMLYVVMQNVIRLSVLAPLSKALGCTLWYLFYSHVECHLAILNN